MFFPSSPLALDLFDAFPFLGMPKPLLCDLSPPHSIHVSKRLLSYEKSHHADLDNARHSTLLAALVSS
jgi:hypothetical protein